MTTHIPTDIDSLITPCCLIELKKMQRNVARLSAHIGKLGCKLRPHVKTHKSIDVTRAIIQGGNVQGITVSTLREAEYFFEHGITDILYAVGIVPGKLAEVARLIQKGCDLKIVLDNPDMAHLIEQASTHYNCVFPVMIEIDVDGHRAGINPNSNALLETGRRLQQCPNIKIQGVMAHAGESYGCFDTQSKQDMARQERDLTLLAAKRLRSAGIDCPDVSIGSTPTAHFIDDLTGITDVRAGVYVFFDLVMAGLNVCEEKDIALSVLTSVIGHQVEKGWVITDGGWMAMSRDRGTQDQPIDQGYGLVATKASDAIRYVVADANQEHGIITPRNRQDTTDFSAFPLASTVSVLPNHACATAAQFDQYYVVDGNQVIDIWQSVKGW